MRTEEDIINDFKKLHWHLVVNSKYKLSFKKWNKDILVIFKKDEEVYTSTYYIDFKIHKLINELLEYWGGYNGI